MEMNIHEDLYRAIEKENLTEEALKGLVEKIFSNCSSLDLQPFSKRGFSGAILLIVQGVKITGSRIKTCILKISNESDIEGEFANYKDHVEGCLDYTRVPAVYQHRPQYFKNWGGIAFSKIGSGERSPIQFKEFYASSGIPALCGTLNALFNELMQPWAEPRILRGSPLWEEVYRMTPVKIQSINDNISPLLSGGFYKYLSSSLNPIEYCKRLSKTRIPGLIETIIHGDLNSANILFKDNLSDPWLIDFAHTGYGHYLRDFAKLESEIKFVLMDKENEEDLKRLPHWLDMDHALDIIPFGEPLCLLPSYPKTTEDPEIIKAYSIIRHLRSLAFDRMIGNKELHIAQYRISLFFYTLETLTFRDISLCKKVLAFRSASRLCQFIRVDLNNMIKKNHTAPNYLMFLGRSGDESWHVTDDIERRYYGITGLIFPHRSYMREFVREAQDIIIKHQIPLDFKFEYHSKENYNNDLLGLLKKSKFIIIAVVIDKYVQAYVKPGTRGNFYASNLNDIITIFVNYLNIQKKIICLGSVIGPHVGSQPSRSRKAYEELLKQGTGTRSATYFKQTLTAKNLTERPTWPDNITEERMGKEPLTVEKCKELRISDYLGLKLANILTKTVTMDICLENGIRPDKMGQSDKLLLEVLKAKYWKNPCTMDAVGFGKVFIKE